MLAGKQQQGEAELPRGKCPLSSAASVPPKPPAAACRDLEHQGQRESPVKIFSFPYPPFDVLFPLPPQVHPSGKSSAPQLTHHTLLPLSEPLQTPKQ